MSDPGGQSHPDPRHGHHDCPHCRVQPGKPGTAKVAWIIAGIAVALLVAVFVAGFGTTTGNLFASGGLVLLVTLACPLVMGGMMFFMMRKGH